jgi:protein-S-isoprenylcysteine O-methyltransferase Ste14
MRYAVLILAWIVYFVLHSILAADGIKIFVAGISGSLFRFYRIMYSFISSIGLMALLILNASVTPITLFESKGFVRYLSLMLATFGVIVISQAFKQYRLISFLGIKQEMNEFTRNGILQHVRHPIYSGTILVVIGFFLFTPTLATLISVSCILIYLPIGIHFEEKKLIKQFGEQYLSYKREVPSVMPHLKKYLFKKVS